MHIADLNAYKIAETEAVKIGYGGILKQKKNNIEQIVQFTSKHPNKLKKIILLSNKKFYPFFGALQNFKVIY